MSGRTILMKFDDGSVAPIPLESVNDAISAGASVYKSAGEMRPSHDPKSTLPSAGQMAAMDMPVAVGSTLGSIAGGALGSVGGPAGAFAGRQLGGMAGGSAGKAIQEGAWRAAGLGDAPGTVGGEAVTQGALGMLGEGAGLLAQGAGRLAIRSGLPARLQNGWGAVSEIVKERLPFGGFDESVPVLGKILPRGGRRAGENLGRKVAVRDAANMAAENAGVRIRSGPMQQWFLDKIDDYNLRGDRSKQLSALAQRMDDFLVTWRSGSLSPREAQKYLSSLDEEAKTIWRSENKLGQHVPEAERRAAQQAKSLADRLRGEFRRLVPNHRSTSAAVANAAAAKGAIDEATHAGVPSHLVRAGIGAPVGAAIGMATGERDPVKLLEMGAIGGAALTSPAVMSRTGLMLTDPVMQMLLRQTPRLASRQNR